MQEVLPAFEQGASAWLLLTVDAALGGVLFFAPLLMGGREPLGQFVFVSLVCAAALAWTLRQGLIHSGRWVFSGAELLILVGLALLGLQLIPLPSSLIARLSPGLTELLPLWNVSGDGPVHLGAWRYVSLEPGETRAGLAIYLAYALLFAVAYQRIARLEDVERLIGSIGIAAGFMAAFGLVQYLTSNGKFCWVFEHPYRNTLEAVTGSFANPNHFAHFLAVGLGPLLWWLTRLMRDPSPRSTEFGPTGREASLPQLAQYALAGALVVVIFAGLLSFSRGGMAALLLAAAVCVGIYVRSSLLGRRSLLTLGTVAILVVAALGIHGLQLVQGEFDTLQSAQTMGQLSVGREKLWTALFKAIPQFALSGAGAGTHREVYPIFLSEYADVEYTHAESGYLQVLLEMGLPGLLLVLAGIGLCSWWSYRAIGSTATIRVRAAGGAAIAGLVVSVLHSIVDFVWYIPACMTLTLLLAACVGRLHRLTTREPEMEAAPEGLALPATAWLVVAAGVAVVGLALANNRLGPALAQPHWNKYLMLSQEARQLTAPDPDATPASAAKVEESLLSLEEGMVGHLQRAVQADPGFSRAHLRLTALWLRHFDQVQRRSANAMDLAQIRDAALASQFASKADQDRWLEVAIGENRQCLDHAIHHARRAMRGCPLHGEAYLYLAELGFLEGNSPVAKVAYVDQALRVRPYRAAVLFFAGKEAALVGDVPRALDCWKRAFHQGPEFRRPIIEMLALSMPTDAFFEVFQPDLAGSELLYYHFQKLNLSEQAAAVAPHYVQALEQQANQTIGSEAASWWHKAHYVYRSQGQGDKALTCAQRAVEAWPNDLRLHQSLAAALMSQERYDEAAAEWQWCLHRRPDDVSLRKSLEKCVTRQIDGVRRATTAQTPAATSSR